MSEALSFAPGVEVPAETLPQPRLLRIIANLSLFAAFAFGLLAFVALLVDKAPFGFPVLAWIGFTCLLILAHGGLGFVILREYRWNRHLLFVLALALLGSDLTSSHSPLSSGWYVAEQIGFLLLWGWYLYFKPNVVAYYRALAAQ